MMLLEKADHGFTCTMTGTVTDLEIDSYLETAKRMLPAGGTAFGLLVDQRDCRLLADSVQVRMGEVIKFFRSRGLERVGIVCPSAVLAMQMNRIATQSGASGVQYALNGTDPEWTAKAQAWIQAGQKL